MCMNYVLLFILPKDNKYKATEQSVNLWWEDLANIILSFHLHKFSFLFLNRYNLSSLNLIGRLKHFNMNRTFQTWSFQNYSNN